MKNSWIVVNEGNQIKTKKYIFDVINYIQVGDMARQDLAFFLLK
jgi:hypothetical protein